MQMAYYLAITSQPTFLSSVSLNQHRSHGPIFVFLCELSIYIFLLNDCIQNRTAVSNPRQNSVREKNLWEKNLIGKKICQKKKFLDFVSD